MKFFMIIALVVACLLSMGSYVQAVGKKCPVVCPQDYRPLCAGQGKNQQTFSNACALETYNCNNRNQLTKIRDGAC